LHLLQTKPSTNAFYSSTIIKQKESYDNKIIDCNNMHKKKMKKTNIYEIEEEVDDSNDDSNDDDINIVQNISNDKNTKNKVNITYPLGSSSSQSLKLINPIYNITFHGKIQSFFGNYLLVNIFGRSSKKLVWACSDNSCHKGNSI
jgi:hypothetical protein